MMRIVFFIMLASVLLSGCNANAKKEEVVNYISNPNNGVVKVFERDGFKLKMLYRPASLLAYQDAKANPQLNVDSLTTVYSKYHHFTMSLSLNDRDVLSQVDRELYGSLLDKFNKTLNQNVYALASGVQHEISLYDWFLNRTYGHSNSTDIFCVFEASQFDNSDEVTICFKDLLDIGETIKIAFKKQDIQNVPKIFTYEN